jgi:hypothetical protein
MRGEPRRGTNSDAGAYLHANAARHGRSRACGRTDADSRAGTIRAHSPAYPDSADRHSDHYARAHGDVYAAAYRYACAHGNIDADAKSDAKSDGSARLRVRA